MNIIMFYISYLPIILSLAGIIYFVYLNRKYTKNLSFKHLLLLVILVSVAMSGFRLWYNLNYVTLDCGEVNQCFVGWGVYDGNINQTDIQRLADLNYSLDDAPFPHIVWGFWSIVFGVNDLSFLVINEVVLSVICGIIFLYTRRLYPVLLFQLAPLTLSLTITFAVLDDVIGFLFFALIVIVIETKNQNRKKWVYPLIILTVLSHKVPTLYLLGYFMLKREYKGLLLLSFIVVAALGIGFLGYPAKTVYFTDAWGWAFGFEPLLSFIVDTSYAIQILMVVQSILLAVYFVKTRNPGGKSLLFLTILPFLIPLNSGDHTLLWRMLWINIVLVPLMFHNNEKSKLPP